MRILAGLIIAVAVNAILNSKPSGNYCGSPVIPSKGKGFVQVNVTSDTAFNISASWTPTGGSKKSGTETDVPYSYDDSTQDVTVTDTSKLQDLITKIDAPLKASDLAHLHYDGKDLHVVALLNFPLEPYSDLLQHKIDNGDEIPSSVYTVLDIKSRV
ncbi:hypothetical protein Pmar_PMAR001565 [Perkinsus marinus ATCC 50983]|uniref:Uncharacterized protein n=1 Tax=Perkinsus marinus (strain ATCC 50983 / TXsc) TaxID=423536 RepID=C5K4L7_PERM5|nr:hypothetical protein Pmar_PMAR001565 [Perkinsus marinus ATCC 50983]EER20584.1 hypothetical protein Pmar_PMAR001565 [Perkinsus marinus ATCC 50983]|eukprot:XP_002788788.1 hypothetical protein Pmar_PMAR001565 [Perkinsus marinus ATCC 50983]